MKQHKEIHGINKYSTLFKAILYILKLLWLVYLYIIVMYVLFVASYQKILHIHVIINVQTCSRICHCYTAADACLIECTNFTLFANYTPCELYLVLRHSFIHMHNIVPYNYCQH